ncbi:outer membrane protein [Bradyrhizobium sp. HKCCYLS20291]|uniref:outer membrane protein n=1 Tax=Bradyrhizobium sp. HKCCYLS20291 TaxID=3420766 RepID=UPI003EB75B32
MLRILRTTKTLILTGAALTAALAMLAAPATAADLGTENYLKAPVAPPQFSWAGFYLGTSGGYAFNRGALGGGLAGATAGYNWQSGNIVVGVEADAAWTDISSSNTIATLRGPGILTVKIQDWGTFRARFGRSFGRLLVYSTGGFAWDEMKLSLAGPGAFRASDSHFHGGWTVGGGVEWMLAPQWTVKLQHLHRNFSSETYTFSALGRSVSRGTGTVGMHSVDIGFNYRF